MSDEPGPLEWTEALKAAHVDVADAAFNLRQFERHRVSSALQRLGRENLSRALDRLEAEDPGAFAGDASDDPPWMEVLRERDGFQHDPPQGPRA